MQTDTSPIDLSGLLRAVARDAVRRELTAKPRTFPSHRGRPGLSDWQFKRVVAYLSSRIDSPVRVGDLAAEVNLSPGHFTRAFTIRLGMAPYTFIMKLRLEQARALLLTSEKSVAEIAVNCGLADQAHFSRLFRRSEGMTPSQW
jgi:transcriptional regulator GlxA family with amidase domain